MPTHAQRQEPSLDRLAKGEGGANAAPGGGDDFISSPGSSGGEDEEEEEEMEEEDEGSGVCKGARARGKASARRLQKHAVASLVANLHTLASVLACTSKVRVGGRVGEVAWVSGVRRYVQFTHTHTDSGRIFPSRVACTDIA